MLGINFYVSWNYLVNATMMVHCIMPEWKPQCNDICCLALVNLYVSIMGAIPKWKYLSHSALPLEGPATCLQRSQFKMVQSQVFLHARVHSNFLFKLEIVHLLLSCNHPLHTEDMWTQKVMERSYAFLIVIGTSHLWKSDCGRWTSFVKIILLLVIIMAIWKHQLYPL